MVFSFLDAIALHTDVRVTSIELEPKFVRWLQAVGLEEGATLRVLRRGLFGGPLHVRSSTGNEMAIHRSLARAVHVVVVSEDARGAETSATSVRQSGTDSELAQAGLGELAPVSKSA